MALTPDSTIGSYTIAHELGRGGMGVVYLARDTRLDREVAIKALPAELATDPARLERFEREARTLASLSHPNLAGIYGIEEHDGARYLILEYVEGETLADILDRGPIPPDEAIESAIQICAGIEAAHEAAVIHRDLKPANIKITPEGKAKVLDFGLARSDESSSSSSSLNLSNSPTVTSPIQHSPTIPGAILGTAPYMSPEQARGRKVDKRTDIWSFGVVLYEMLTGIGPFTGETATDSIGAILHKDIDLELLPKRMPRSVHRLIARTLERDKERRLQAIGDARIELQDALALLRTGQFESAQAATHTSPLRWLWPAAAAILAIGLIAALLAPRATPATATQSTPQRVQDVAQITDFPVIEETPSLSSDGKRIVYAALDNGDYDIFVLRVGGENPINITPNSTEHDIQPAFSPDGERIAFVSTREGGGVFVMGATGENPIKVADEGFSPAWSPDGKTLAVCSEQIFSAYGRTTLSSVSLIDLETRTSSILDTTGTSAIGVRDSDAVMPQWSPDGSRIVYWASWKGQRDLFTVSATGGNRIQLTDDIATDWNPMWSADGRAIYFLSDRSGEMSLWSLAIDPASGQPTAEPQPLMPGPHKIFNATFAPEANQFAFTIDSRQTTIERTTVSPAGEISSERTQIYSTSDIVIQQSVSPDAQWIAFRDGPPTEDIFIMRADGTSSRRLTNSPAKDRGPLWLSDNSALLYYSNQDGNYKIWQINRDGTNPRIILDGKEGSTFLTPYISADDKVLVLSDQAQSGDITTRIYERSESGQYKQANAIEPDFWLISVSPDGSYVLGGILAENNEMQSALMNCTTGEIIKLPSPESTDLRDLDTFSGTWLSNSEILTIDDRSGRAFVYNLETNESRWTGQTIPENTLLRKAANTNDIFIFNDSISSDLWLGDLED